MFGPQSQGFALSHMSPDCRYRLNTTLVAADVIDNRLDYVRLRVTAVRRGHVVSTCPLRRRRSRAKSWPCSNPKKPLHADQTHTGGHRTGIIVFAASLSGTTCSRLLLATRRQDDLVVANFTLQRA